MDTNANGCNKVSLDNFVRSGNVGIKARDFYSVEIII